MVPASHRGSAAAGRQLRGRGRGRGHRGRPYPSKPPLPGCGKGEPDFKPVAFVHVNKAGGTAMRAVLFKHAGHQLLESLVPGAAHYLRSLKPPSRWFHASASLQQAAVGQAKWEESYTFGLVRNPFARQVSMFHFLLGEVSCMRPIGVRPEHCEKRMLPPGGEAWLADPEQAKLRFRKWLHDMRQAFPPGTKDAHFFGSRSHGNEHDSWFNASQISWMVDGQGRQLVDEIIRLEDLDAAWPQLQRKICGLRGVVAGDNGLRRNPSKHVHYSHYYDDETRRIMEEYMAVDLQRFGYTFETKPTSN